MMRYLLTVFACIYAYKSKEKDNDAIIVLLVMTSDYQAGDLFKTV